MQVVLIGAAAAVLFIVGGVANFATGHGGFGTLMLLAGIASLIGAGASWNAARQDPVMRLSPED